MDKKSHFLLVGVETGTTILKHHVELPGKSGSMKTYDPAVLLLSIYCRETYTRTTVCLYKTALGSIAFKSPNVETPK